MVMVAAPTATAAFAQKLHSPGVINSRRTKHSPQGQRFRRRWRGCGGCGGSGSGVGGCGGGGGDERKSRRWLLVLCGDVMGATRKSFYHQKRFHGSIFLDPLPPNIFHGRSFLPIATSSSVAHWNRCTCKTLHGSRTELVSTLCNEQRPQLISLSVLGSSTGSRRYSFAVGMEKIELLKNSLRI